ncbi:MAG: hypothetical protein RPU52_15340 [Candidatus Sedimenticola sp. (ex Thyasira tokunagai)]
MKAFNMIIVVAITGLVTACAMPPKKSLGIIPSEENSKVLFTRLHDLAEKCWEKEWGWFGDGVVISATSALGGNIIEGKRYAPDIGIRPPFIEVIVSEHTTGATVEIIEGGEHNPLSDNSLAPEVTSWINGASSCLTKK